MVVKQMKEETNEFEKYFCHNIKISVVLQQI